MVVKDAVSGHIVAGLLEGLETTDAAPNSNGQAETPCTKDSDCLGDVCATTMMGFLESKGYDLESQGITGFSPKVCKKNLQDVTISLNFASSLFPEYQYLYEQAKDKWLSIIRGIGRQLTVPVPAIQITVDFVNFPRSFLAAAGPTNVELYDEIDGGSFWYTTYGEMLINLWYLTEGLISEEVIQGVIEHEMGHIFLIGFWDLVSTSAQCETNETANEPFTNVYLDGGGKASMAHYILSQQWNATVKTPLRLYRTPGLQEPGADCGHWSEALLDNELMTPRVNDPDLQIATEALSIITAGSVEDLGYTVDYANCDVYPNSFTNSPLYNFKPSSLLEMKGKHLDKPKDQMNREQQEVQKDFDFPEIQTTEVKFTYKEKVIAVIPSDRNVEGMREAKLAIAKFLRLPRE